jgi:(p)ppGpp synthase/HD superfamily hydrolase
MSFQDRLKLVREIVTQRHVFDERQTYQGLPYTHHLIAVADVAYYWAIRFQANGRPLLTAEESEDLVIAAWAHDLLEDTATSRKELEELFGERVAQLVWAVTNEPGEDRRTRHAHTYPKIRAEPLAVLLKLCDRLANVRASAGTKGFREMYAKEYEDFKRALYTPGQWELAWVELEMEACGIATSEGDNNA